MKDIANIIVLRPSPTAVHCTPPITTPPGTPSAPAAGPAIDDEFHFLIRFPRLNSDRNSVFSRLGQLNPSFLNLTEDEKFKTLLCQTSAFTTKLVHRFIKQMLVSREKYDEDHQIRH